MQEESQEKDDAFAANYVSAIAAVLTAWCGGDGCHQLGHEHGGAIGQAPLWHATLEMCGQGCAARTCRARGRVRG